MHNVNLVLPGPSLIRKNLLEIVVERGADELILRDLLCRV